MSSAPPVIAAIARRRERLELLLPEREEVGVEDDVGVENLPGVRIHAAGPIAKPALRGDPAERVVVDVFRIPVGVVGLLADLDRVDEAGLLEGLVPFQDAVADRLAILERDRLLDPEDDRLLGRRELGRRIGLLQVPAIDVADELVAVALASRSPSRRSGSSRRGRRPGAADSRCVGNLADRVVDVDRHAAASRARCRSPAVPPEA